MANTKKNQVTCSLVLRTVYSTREKHNVVCNYSHKNATTNEMIYFYTLLIIKKQLTKIFDMIY